MFIETGETQAHLSVDWKEGIERERLVYLRERKDYLMEHWDPELKNFKKTRQDFW